MQNTSISQRVFSIELELEQLRLRLARIETTNDSLVFKLNQTLRQLSGITNLISQNEKYRDYLQRYLETEEINFSVAPPPEQVQHS